MAKNKTKKETYGWALVDICSGEILSEGTDDLIIYSTRTHPLRDKYEDTKIVRVRITTISTKRK